MKNRNAVLWQDKLFFNELSTFNLWPSTGERWIKETLPYIQDDMNKLKIIKWQVTDVCDL